MTDSLTNVLAGGFAAVILLLALLFLSFAGDAATRLERFLLRTAAVVIVGVLWLALAGPAAAEPVRPSMDLDAVRIEVTWVSSRDELHRVRDRYVHRDVRSAASTADANSLRGFSILGKRDGERVCLVYAFRPEQVDDDATTALGHELAHCLLGAYHQ